MTETATAPLDTVAFLGGGQMARALIGGLRAAGQPAGTLFVADVAPAACTALEQAFPGVTTTGIPGTAAARARVWVLAVKPQNMAALCAELAPLAQSLRPVVVSVAAGIRSEQLQAWLGAGVAVIRTMPNRPALVGAGITALYATPGVDAAARAQAEALMAAAGATVWVDDEAQLDAVTAVSGSGPAYFFLLVEALEAAAIQAGLPPATARRLAVETAHGAGRMASQTGVEPAVLREQVTSKGGTTAAALAVFEAGGFRALVNEAVAAAARRSAELGGAPPPAP